MVILNYKYYITIDLSIQYCEFIEENHKSENKIQLAVYLDTKLFSTKITSPIN